MINLDMTHFGVISSLQDAIETKLNAINTRDQKCDVCNENIHVKLSDMTFEPTRLAHIESHNENHNTQRATLDAMIQLIGDI